MENSYTAPYGEPEGVLILSPIYMLTALLQPIEDALDEDLKEFVTEGNDIDKCTLLLIQIARTNNEPR